MEQTDEKSILSRLSGDEASRRRAFEEIVRANSETLYWHIRQIVLNHDDSNDILQNTFIKAWNNIDTFQANSKISTWLYRIAINESITFLSRQKSNNFVDIDNPDINIHNQLESDPYFDGDETEAMLREAVALLPEKQRIIFTMKYFEEMKYEDISAILGTSVGALKTSYHLAVKKIENFFNNRD